MKRKTFQEELAYYNALKVADNIYIGEKNIITGYRIIEGNEKGYTSGIIPHRHVEALKAYRNAL